jgi:hypothetical protein
MSTRRATVSLSPRAMGRWALGAVALGAVVGACGTPNPRMLEASEEARGMPSAELGSAMTEQDKIQALIDAVRTSDRTFVHDGIERTGSATADKLKLLLERDPTGVRSAREFIERIAAPERPNAAPDGVRVAPDELLPARHWYLVRLAELEGRPVPPDPPEAKAKAEVHARRLLILDALALVERSELRFVAPPRPPSSSKPPRPSTGPKRKPKRKQYTGPEFADMLRKKWEFLGADIEDLDTFIDEIASDSFASMVRYRVVHEDGREEDFGQWLRSQVAITQPEAVTAPSLAQGGAP